MVKLFDEPTKPSEAINFLLEFLGVPQSENADSLLKEFEKEQLENIKLRAEIRKVQREVHVG